jgi:hypothetical protein
MFICCCMALANSKSFSPIDYYYYFLMLSALDCSLQGAKRHYFILNHLQLHSPTRFIGLLIIISHSYYLLGRVYCSSFTFLLFPRIDYVNNTSKYSKYVFIGLNDSASSTTTTIA